MVVKWKAGVGSTHKMACVPCSWHIFVDEPTLFTNITLAWPSPIVYARP